MHRRRGPPGRPSQQRPDPGDEHGEGERLGEVVVGAGVERLGLVEVAALGGEHQDRRPVAGLPQVGADQVAVAARQHDVEHDQVVAALGRHPQPVLAVEGDLDGVALGLEAPLDGRGDLLVVLDQEQFHHRPPVRVSTLPPEPLLNERRRVGRSGGDDLDLVEAEPAGESVQLGVDAGLHGAGEPDVLVDGVHLQL